MCGRAKLPEEVSELKLDLRIDWDGVKDFKPRWNAAPTTDLPVVTFAQGKRALEMMRWGLVPSWAKDMKIGRSAINARAETIDRQPIFRDAWRAGRRCLVIADAYYEWRKPDRQPFAIALANRGPMTFAGVWDTWRTPGGDTVKSFAIVTTTANDLLVSIHDRMPVIVATDDWPLWLGEVAGTDDQLKSLLKPYPSERMTAWAVSPRVGNVRNDGPDLLEPITAQPDPYFAAIPAASKILP